MTATLRSLAVASLGLLIALVAVLPMGAAAADTDAAEVVRAEDVVVSDEAWFYRFRQPVPELPEGDDDPTGGYLGIARAEVRSRTNPFPFDTLHVAVVAGEPIARTFVGISTFDAVDEMASITGGTLRLVDNEEDSVNAEAADMVACPTTELVVAESGGDWDAQYPFDCSAHSPLTLVEGSDPLTWEVDLAPFAEVFDGELSPGLAIVERGALEEDPAPDPTQTWHVSFDASTRTEAQLAPDSTALVDEVDALLRTLTHVENIVQVIQDPDSLPAFLVLQVLPNVNALWDQSRVVRQTDPDRDLRPSTADLELELQAAGDFPDFEQDTDSGFEASGDDPHSAPADSSFDAGSEPSTPAATSPSSSPSTSSSDVATDIASAPMASDTAPGTPDAEDATESALTASPEQQPTQDQAMANGIAEHVGATGPGAALLLLPLALSVAGALGWSLTQPAQIPMDRSGGALDRMMSRSGRRD